MQVLDDLGVVRAAGRSIAWAATWPTEYASATSAFTPDALTWYCFTYSLTIALLAALLKPGYQPLGTIIPAALPGVTAEVNAAPWSGPDAAMNIFGV